MLGKIICILLIVLLAVSAVMLNSQDKDRYYIFFDNSWSMKRYDFYPRLLGSLIGGLKNEGREKEFIINYVPFGTRRSIEYFNNYNQFSNKIKKDFATTDFVNLGSTLSRIRDDDKVIIISDGEHDTSNNLPFTNLTEEELKQMMEVVDTLQKRGLQVYALHILKDHSHVNQKDIANYYNSLKRKNQAAPPGNKSPVTQSSIIAALTKDFMKRLATGSGDYYLCADNKAAVNALFKIFEISTPIACDTSHFKTTIPLDITFGDWVEHETKQWFWQELENYPICIAGVTRKFEENPTNTLFNLTVDYINNDAYTVRFGQETLWNEKQIFNRSDMNNCIQRIVGKVKSKIDNELLKSPDYAPRFTVPQCLISIKFEDEKLYAFIKEKNFNLYKKDCQRYTWKTADVFFFDEDKRAYLLIPVMVAKRLLITAPGQPKGLKVGKSINLEQENISSWDTEELTVKKDEIKFPTISFNFTGFFNNEKGTLLFFSVVTGRFFGMVSDSSPQLSFTLFKDQRYRIYFVPDDIKSENIKSIPRQLSEERDVPKALNLLNPTRDDVVFEDWKDCLERFDEAKAEPVNPENLTQTNTRKKKTTSTSDSPANLPTVDSRGKVARQIARSNGYFHLLQHLGDIMDNQEFKRIFKDLLNQTIEEYKGSGMSPFKVIELLQAEIPVFSHELREKYLGLGSRAKIQTIIQVLTNPIQNLTELKHYIEGNLVKVTAQNQNYFHELED